MHCLKQNGVVLHQQCSTRDNFVPSSRGHLSGDTFCCHNWGEDVLLTSRGQSPTSCNHRIVHTTKNYPAPNVNSAKVKKLCSTGTNKESACGISSSGGGSQLAEQCVYYNPNICKCSIILVVIIINALDIEFNRKSNRIFSSTEKETHSIFKPGLLHDS